MILIVDKNEKDTAPKVVKLLEKCFSQVVIANLPHHAYGGITVTAGDINIPLDNGSIFAIDRKTPQDFLNSIPNRHIFNQIEVMAQYAKYSSIIITGFFHYDKNDMVWISDNGKLEAATKTNWKGVSVRSTMSLIQYSGCALIFCPPARYPDQIAELYNTVNKPDKHQGITQHRIVTFPPVDNRITFLAGGSGLPGIGIKLADTLLTFAGMMDGDADEQGYGTLAGALHWVTILSGISKSERPKGWGPEKILTVRKFLGLSSNQYIKTQEE